MWFIGTQILESLFCFAKLEERKYLLKFLACKIYSRDKPKYPTLNSNNLNNCSRYSDINNFLGQFSFLKLRTQLICHEDENEFGMLVSWYPVYPPLQCSIISIQQMVSEYPGNNDTCVSSIMQAGLSCHFLLMYAMQYASRPLNVSLCRADVLHPQ